MLVFEDGRKSAAGYGVMELVIVVSMSFVITTMAVIGFSSSRERYELRQRARTLTSQIERARSIAIKMNQTLTLGFSSDGKTFGLTCTDCPEATDELKSITLPNDLELSAFPTISIRGNGTITVQGSAVSLILTDEKGRSLEVTLNNSGRVVMGDVTDPGVSRSTGGTGTSPHPQ